MTLIFSCMSSHDFNFCALLPIIFLALLASSHTAIDCWSCRLLRFRIFQHVKERLSRVMPPLSLRDASLQLSRHLNASSCPSTHEARFL